jgi:hypothetical protein
MQSYSGIKATSLRYVLIATIQTNSALNAVASRDNRSALMAGQSKTNRAALVLMTP